MHERTPMHGQILAAFPPYRWHQIKNDPCQAWTACISAGMAAETITVRQCTKSWLCMVFACATSLFLAPAR